MNFPGSLTRHNLEALPEVQGILPALISGKNQSFFFLILLVSGFNSMADPVSLSSLLQSIKPVFLASGFPVLRFANLLQHKVLNLELLNLLLLFKGMAWLKIAATTFICLNLTSLKRFYSFFFLAISGFLSLAKLLSVKFRLASGFNFHLEIGSMRQKSGNKLGSKSTTGVYFSAFKSYFSIKPYCYLGFIRNLVKRKKPALIFLKRTTNYYPHERSN